MAILSPGVYPREIDQSFGTPSTSDSIGAIIINSNKGPTEVTEVTSRSQFVRLYGEPTSDTPSKHVAIRFLRSANRLNVFRVTNDAEVATISVEDTDVTETFTVDAANSGAWGNNLSVDFSDTPSDSDVFRMFIYENDIEVESFDVSKVSDQKDGFGQSLYIEDVVNNRSEFVRVTDDASNSSPPEFDTTYELTGGSDDTAAPTDSEVVDAWDNFTNVESVDANILINAGWASETVQNKMVTVAENRKDSIAVLDIPEGDATSVGDMTTYVNDDLNANTSWAAIYGPWIQVYDQYNDRNIMLPPSGDVAGVYAVTSSQAEPWNAPAGLRRGILNVLDVQTDLNQGDRDMLYDNNINPIVDFSGEGTVVWGQKTLQRQASSLDRVNVRRLIIHIQQTLEPALKPFVFENNTAFVRENIASLIENFMEDVQVRRGVTDFSVIVDETNNTSQVIDSNQLVVDLYMKPSRTAEFIRLNTILSPTGVDFN